MRAAARATLPRDELDAARGGLVVETVIRSGMQP